MDCLRLHLKKKNYNLKMYIRTSLEEVGKIAIEKYNFFTLTTHFCIHTPKYSLLYSLFF
jgi:hypothetical protein